MRETEMNLYSRRISEEVDRAAAASTAVARHAHLRLADLYRRRLFANDLYQEREDGRRASVR
jgi:hypothetical protein